MTVIVAVHFGWGEKSPSVEICWWSDEFMIDNDGDGFVLCMTWFVSSEVYEWVSKHYILNHSWIVEVLLALPGVGGIYRHHFHTLCILYLYLFIFRIKTTKQGKYTKHALIQNNEIRLDCPTQLCLRDTAVLPRGPGKVYIINSIIQ